MSKLYFRYGTMNSGKSTLLINTAYNYKERGMNPIIIKPIIDNKTSHIINRAGLSWKVDYLVKPEDNLLKVFKKLQKEPVSIMLVDEVQFLTVEQVDSLLRIVVEYNIPIICYGLRTDFRGLGFPASTRLLEVADSLQEIRNICSCGKKATFNARRIGEKFIKTGDQIIIDNGQNKKIEYESFCAKCYDLNVGL